MSTGIDAVPRTASAVRRLRSAVEPLAKVITRRWRTAGQVRSFTLICAVGLGFSAGVFVLPLMHWQSGKVITEFAALLMTALVVHLVASNEAQRHALQETLQDEQSYRSFVMSAIEGAFRTTADGQYLFANLALARIYGYSSPDHLKQELTNIANQLYVVPGRRLEFQNELQEKGYVADFQSQIRRRDGTLIWIAENSKPVFDKDGQFLFYEGTVEDITALREAEETTRRAIAEVREAARSKDAFLASMSHELRTPLNAIIGFSEIMETERFGPLGNSRYQDYAGDISDSGRHLLGLINDILDLSKLEAGQLELHDETVAVAAAIRDCLKFVEPQVEKSKLQVFNSLAAGMTMIRADGRRIRQVLLNVLSNAVKFTPENGIVSISSVYRDGGLAIAISDTGIGMTPAGIVKALQPFGQVDSKLSRKYEGTGLGLPLAKQLIEMHGGTLTIESQAGIGTTVTIFVPAERVVSTADIAPRGRTEKAVSLRKPALCQSALPA
jgi:PAS domain S-box-containing protein